MKTKIRLSQLLVIGCFFGFFLFCLVWGLAQKTGLWPSARRCGAS